MSLTLRTWKCEDYFGYPGETKLIIGNFKSRGPPVPFFFLKIALAIRGFLCFHTNLEIICSSSVKNVAGSLTGIALNL